MRPSNGKQPRLPQSLVDATITVQLLSSYQIARYLTGVEPEVGLLTVSGIREPSVVKHPLFCTLSGVAQSATAPLLFEWSDLYSGFLPVMCMCAT